VVVDSRPVYAQVPPRCVDPAVIAADEQIEVIRRACYGRKRCPWWEKATNCSPVVVDSRPVYAQVPPRCVGPAGIAADEQIKVISLACYRRKPCPLCPYATLFPSVVVDSRPVYAQVPPRCVDPAVIAADEQIEVIGRACHGRNRCPWWEKAANCSPVVVDS